MGAMIRRCPFGAVDLNRVEIHGEQVGGLVEYVGNANRAAIRNARDRLHSQFSSAAIDSLQDYFLTSAFHPWPGDESTRPRRALETLLADLCSRVRSLAIGKKSQGLQVEIRSSGERQIDPHRLGIQIEPDSDLFLLSPEALCGAAAANASVEVRLFDRQCTEWSCLADDLSAVSGADIFLKLFISGGDVSVNGWHRDASDVMVTVLDGSKRFEVGTPDSKDARPVSEIDRVLRPGDAVLLPRSQLHNATPTPEVSALLSIGMMRYGDWAYRDILPTHMGLVRPRSSKHYRLALRPHRTANWGGFDGASACETRIPGGIGIIGYEGDLVRFVAAGEAYDASVDVVRWLASVHRESGRCPATHATGLGRSPTWGTEVARDLAALGLIIESPFAPTPVGST